MKKNSTGLIECRCFSSAVAVIDLLSKQYSLSFLPARYPGKALVTIIFTGSTADVKGAVDTGTEFLKKLGHFYSASVLLNPDTSLNLHSEKKISAESESEPEPITEKSAVSETVFSLPEAVPSQPETVPSEPETVPSEPETVSSLPDGVFSVQEPISDKPHNCNFICSLCDAKDCPDRWK